MGNHAWQNSDRNTPTQRCKDGERIGCSMFFVSAAGLLGSGEPSLPSSLVCVTLQCTEPVCVCVCVCVVYVLFVLRVLFVSVACVACVVCVCVCVCAHVHVCA